METTDSYYPTESTFLMKGTFCGLEHPSCSLRVVPRMFSRWYTNRKIQKERLFESALRNGSIIPSSCFRRVAGEAVPGATGLGDSVEASRIRDLRSGYPNLVFGRSCSTPSIRVSTFSL